MDDNAPGNVQFSHRARSFFTSNYATISKIAARAARAYGSMAEDLIQDAFMALLKAFDGDFDPGREDWRGYVKVVLERAISHAYHATLRSRGPVVELTISDGSGSAGGDGGGPYIGNAIADESMRPDRQLVDRERARERNARRVAKMRRLRGSLSAAEREVLDLRIRPPAELIVMSRNLHGDDGSGHGARLGEITVDDIARFTDTRPAEVKRRIRTVRVKCAELR